MSWQDVNDILRFWEPGDPGTWGQELSSNYALQSATPIEWDYDIGEPDIVRQILFDLYQNSATGRQVLEKRCGEC